MYDRTALRTVAAAKGDECYVDLADRLKVAPVTAWRLWNGKTAPSARVAAAVEVAYGLSASALLKPSQQAAA
ncbi:XRE family transcriptional regulator [Streptomyces sp. BB1-1-1]|uniref:XRE family transcriptional regulator n=1 Tax=Streptomyces sp. BB1-1-1 TaxID=3074430 RepID=UPI002877882C|nr:XRE family transcriptional regulator [Streptomyces sp. BB1-1-1]WND36958.1 XRE family transcriptional regulator [Streptomyces sp. BB1-1-1]